MPLSHTTGETRGHNEAQYDEMFEEHGEFTSSGQGQWQGVTDEGYQAISTAPMPPVEDSSMNHKEPQYSTSAQASIDEIQVMRRVITSLPRPQTFHRQQSEKRERLLPAPELEVKRRAESSETKQTRSCSANKSTTRAIQPFTSAPDLITPSPMSEVVACAPLHSVAAAPQPYALGPPHTDDVAVQQQHHTAGSVAQPQALHTTDCDIPGTDGTTGDTAVQQQFRDHWVLNLSMHFRDKSNREKFFITYAQTPNLWRRMTISLDYRDAPADSLEAELSELHFQRDKSFRIFDALRESLPEIQFYDTVTNLKLETTPEDGQLHVHVREDANEIIEYPSALLMSQIDCELYTESEISYHSHVSGFVYKVVVDGKILIKKEIPGPDTIDEFLYEVNALDSLLDCENVIHLEGLITSNDGTEIKGLLIPYCTKGALVDIIYDWEAEQLPLDLRLKWARQIIQGLANIHEAGFVQGDFTLSNIVVDEHDDAHIIDINRRGCPVGWEPPELSCLIEQGQRISMYIGVKTDLFQLGMVLWGLARLNDEPERCARPLEVLEEMPDYYQDVVCSCLSARPQDRQSAATLLRRMDRGMQSLPSSIVHQPQARGYPNNTTAKHRSSKQYIDPEAAVTIDDINSRSRYSYHARGYDSPTIPQSRGRSPGCSSRHRSSFFDGATTSATSVSASPVLHERQYCDLKDVTSYPQEICSEDLDDKHYDMLTDLPHVPLHYHRIQHEDSGFDEHLGDSLLLTAATRMSSDDQEQATDTASKGQDPGRPRS
ncbi:hypothetical protein AMS68_006469 [Peltaster fructicola]|uniref:non-specific serine/threonine protein kinase n=1 Tax=Peltaster fructicola TaxID=286661 RepID=A0A6H0Y1P4_9PEZI|nr:hypothetical protein AMS68_006469 [Peltaster fructicola]